MEARVLLTDDAIFDVVYLDVLKGQNFSQTTTGAATLQSGSPFRFHTSVHSPTGFTSSAALQTPSNSVKTLTQQNGSPNYLSRDESFTTKSLLDAAYASGNYKPTIMHPLSVQFSPSLDVSAAANQSPGSITFNSQAVAPNSSGVFHEVWSPLTPVVDVDGSVTATHFSATLKGHTNAALTGSISADWNGTQYVGTYTFNGASGNVSIPEAIATTLSLPADAYPNAPHITNFTAAQTLNPAADFTLTWDAFSGGMADDLITLFIFDGNNQVFHTDAIPLPSGSPQLNGTATSFVLPKNTLLANKTYNAQLWFTNFTSIDTMSFPGAKATTGYYIATNFTMKTGTAVDTSPADVVAYYVSKAQEFVQESSGAPVLNTEDFPFVFLAHVEERDDESPTVDAATVKIPASVDEPLELFPDGEGDWDWLEEFEFKSELDAFYKSGKYTFALDTVNQGLKSPAVTLPSDAYPVTPQITNWTDTQLVDATSSFTLNWNAFTNGTTDDFIKVSIMDDLGDSIFETPDFWESNSLTGTARSVVIPADTFFAGGLYNAQLLFANTSTLDRTTYKGAVGTTAYGKITSFNIQTIPPAGVLQFQTTGYSVNENANPAIATITVIRTGGSEGEVEVQYVTSNGSAADGSDYTGVTGTLTFADGQTSQTFDIPILDDTQSEGHETVTLQLMDPTNDALLGARATAALTILDNELTFGPGKFVDSDGDQYTVALTGPGQARIAVNDPDGDGKGSIAAILLSNTTTATSVTITVTKAATGDGEVPIGRVTGTGSLSAFTAAKSDFTGSGFAVDGVVGQLTVDDVLQGADIVVGGVLANATKFTLGDVAAGTELRSGATVSALTAQTFLGNLIQAPAITALTVNAGLFAPNLNVVNAIKTLTLKAGGASGDWRAGTFGAVSMTGGHFTGTLRATASGASLGTTAAITSLSVTGGNLSGRVSANGKIGPIKVLKNTTGQGGTISNAVISSNAVDSVLADLDFVNSMLLSGADLGADGAIGGTLSDADRFAAGSINAVTVRRNLTSSVIGSGFDPLDGEANNDNDAVIGGNASEIKSLTVGGVGSADSLFAGGAFKGTVKINNLTLLPKNDSRFFVGGGLNVLEATRSRIAAGADHLVILPGGSSVEIPAGVFDVDQIATLTRVSTTPTKPPSGIFIDVGSSLALVFSPAPAPIAASDEPAGDGEPIDPSLHFELKLGSAPVSGLNGSIAVANIVDPVAGNHFTAVPFEVDGADPKTIRMDLPASTVKAVNSNVASTQLGFSMMNLSLVDPLLQPKPVAPHVFWDGKAFKAFPASGLPTGFRNTGKTLVLVHGMNSSADNAFGHCVEEYKSKYGYDQVVAFNYDWTQNIEESGAKLAAFLKVLQLRGITNVDLVAHSEGVPVTLAGTSRTDISNIGIGKITALGGPIMGTPAANAGVGLANALLYPLYFGATSGLATLALVGASTIEDLLERGFAQDLRSGSAVLEGIRNRFAANRSGTVLYLLAGTNPTGSSGMAKLSKVTGKIFNFLGEEHDGIIGRSSALAEDWNPGNGLKIKRLGSLLLSHDQLECDEAAIDRVAKAINPPVAEVIVRTSAGRVTPSTLLLTSENRTQATFEVLLSREPEGSVTINLGTNDDTEGVANPRSFIFTRDDWFRAQQVMIEGVDDALPDGDQNYKIVIAPAVSDDPDFNGRDPQDVSVKNLDNDRSLSISDVTKSEGNSGTTIFLFQLTLSTPSTEPISVDFATSDGSGKAGSDYTAFADRVRIEPMQTSKTVPISVKGDTTRELDETFFVSLSNASLGTQIADARGTGCIVNDDQAATGLTGTWKGTWSRVIGGFGTEVNELTWTLTQVGTSVTGSFIKKVIDEVVDPVGTITTGSLLQGVLSGTTLTIVNSGGTKFSGTTSSTTISGNGGGTGLGGGFGGPFSLTKLSESNFQLGQKEPNASESLTVGEATHPIALGSEAFNALVRNENPDVVFFDDENDGIGDHKMTAALSERVDRLAELVKAEWPGTKLLVTDAWDEGVGHTANSTHYEGRAVDIEVFPVDKKKLGRLARLAVDAGFGWVWYENSAHVHASVR